MATESLGSAVLHLSVDATNFEAALARSKNAAHGLGTEVEKTFQGLDAKTKRVATSLIRWSDLFGQSAENAKFLNAAIRGVPLNIIAAVQSNVQGVKEEMASAARAAELLGIKAQHAADGLAFQEAQAGAQRVHRMQEAVSTFTAELDRLDAIERDQGAKNAFIASLQQQAQAIGKTRAELLEMKAAEMGVSQQAAPFIAKLKEQEQALFKTGAQFNAYGLSAKQTAAALRQVPAQLTDIIVSLQGGQNPLTVFLQQGGQLRDVFGGAAPALKALGSAVLGLVNPFTVGAAAIVAWVAAINDAQSRQGALANALVTTGNAANTTSGELAQMAKVLDDTTASSERHADAVVAQVAATGRFTTEQVAQVSKAALLMEEATGRAISETVKDFAAIGDDPVAAIKSLNNAIGDATGITNFLTAEQVKSIEKMQEQGNTAEATRILFEAYADAINDRAPKITQNLSLMARQWRSIKEFAGDALDATVSALNGMDEAIVDSLRNMTNETLHFRGVFGETIKAPEVEKPKVTPPITNADLKVQDDFNSLVKSNLSDEEKQQREINRIRNEGDALKVKHLTDERTILKAIADSEARFAEQQERKKHKGGGAARSLENAQAKAAIQEFKDALLQQQDALDNSNRVLQAQYAARLVTAEDYYKQERALTEQGTKAQEAALEGEIAALRQRDVQGKVSVDNLRQIGELEAQLAKVRADGATQLVVLGIQEEEFYRRRSEAIQAYRDALFESNEALRLQTNQAIFAIGVGQQQAQRQAELNAVYEDQAQKLRELGRQLENHAIDQTQYDDAVAAQQDFVNQRIAILKSGYEQMDAMESDWRNGLRAGLEDWITNTSKVASQIRDITQRELGFATDALVNFAETGKIEIRSLLADMLKELVKFFAQRAVMMFAQMFLNSFGGGPTNFGIPMPGSGTLPGFNAKGNAYPGGTSLPSNTVLTKPTLFKFAKGASFGVAGEAGEEAIMPLTRGPDGKLGVLAQGSAAPNIAVSVNTVVNSDGSSSSTVATKGEQDAAAQQFSKRMRDMAVATIQQEMMPGGTLWRAGVGQAR